MITMKKIIPTILFLMISISYGQKLDSIPYEFGHIYFHIYGQGEEIMILSGGPGNDVKTLNSVAENLSKKNKVILLEQRGTGMSLPSKYDKTSLSIDFALDDINSVLNKLKIDKIILIGHSYGSSLATIFTSKFPNRVKSLILVSSAFFDYDSAFVTLCNIKSRLGKEEGIKWEKLYENMFTKEMSDTEKKEWDYLNRLAYFYEKTKIDSYLKIIDKPFNKKTNAVLSQDLITYNFDIKKGLENVSIPIDIIIGRQDITDFMAYKYKVAKPEINIHWIDQCGHFPMFETPKEFYKIVDKLID